MVEIRRILCPIDFSMFSQRAVDHAAALARWYGAELHALHVVPALPALWGVAPALGLAAAELPPSSRQEQALDEWMAPAAASGVRVRTQVREGDPNRAILEYAARFDADLVVMGTHGRGGFERLVLGSVTETVLRQAACPVLTVCRRAVPAQDGPPFKRILCALDFAPASARGVGYALSLAKEADAELTLLHVMEPYDEQWLHQHAPMSAAEYRSFIETQLRARLAKVVTPEEREWCRTTDRLAIGRPWDEIVRTAVEVDAQLIVLGQHSRSATDRWLFGSTTQQVVRHAACPVLTTGPKRRADREPWESGWKEEAATGR